MADHPPLIINTQKTSGALVLSPQGEIATHEAPSMQVAVKEAFEARPTKIIIDLSGVTYMATSGVAALVQAAQLSNKTKVPLVLCGLQDRVRAVFDISRLTGFFKIVPTLAEAVA